MSAELEAFHARMWGIFRRNAVGKTGPQIVAALKAASDKVWAAEIDAAYANMSVDETLAIAFDLTWLTAVNIELTKGKP